MSSPSGEAGQWAVPRVVSVGHLGRKQPDDANSGPDMQL